MSDDYSFTKEDLEEAEQVHETQQRAEIENALSSAARERLQNLTVFVEAHARVEAERDALKAQVEMLEARVQKLGTALRTIQAGCTVCFEYDTCQHIGCESAYKAWAFASAALAPAENVEEASDAV